ncbi:hypothetical protein [Sansalvadorimonas verongulae]|uniref:hypothetical protein n=1 Tax=Sansalvadorimonas verongulae TaxID=2172824 RepID=UPI0012BB86EA|nr:hypothetical protein [Sansalvadorimonas verongulae]MTI13302.1 hypothetical protein [Sansalvadorimonas verongulae]
MERITPCIPQPEYRPVIWEKLWSKISSTDVKKVLQTGTPEDVKTWVNTGGDLNYLDGARNNVVHIMAIGRARSGEFVETKTIAQTVFQHYPQEHIEALCTAKNDYGLTPWHELATHCTLSHCRHLHGGGLAMAEEMMNAGVSPLLAHAPKETKDFPAVALLPYITENEAFLSTVIRFDATLSLKGLSTSVPAQITKNCPTLLWAAVIYEAPIALQYLLSKDALFTESQSPVHPLVSRLSQWHCNPALRRCVKVVIDAGEYLPDNNISADLVKILGTWEKKLRDIEPATPDHPLPRETQEQREAVIEAFRYLLQVIPDIHGKLRVHTASKEPRTLKNGLLMTLRNSFPKLLQVASTIPGVSI